MSVYLTETRAIGSQNQMSRTQLTSVKSMCLTFVLPQGSGDFRQGGEVWGMIVDGIKKLLSFEVVQILELLG